MVYERGRRDRWLLPRERNEERYAANIKVSTTLSALLYYRRTLNSEFNAHLPSGLSFTNDEQSDLPFSLMRLSMHFQASKYLHLRTIRARIREHDVKKYVIEKK